MRRQLPPEDMVRVAEALARGGHAGQVDLAGQPYIEHPKRVATEAYLASGDWEAAQVGWLHDVVEDTAVGLEDLVELGFSERVVEAVDAMSRRKIPCLEVGFHKEEYSDYMARVKANELAVVVKRVDIADNSGEERLGALDEGKRRWLTKKYKKGLAILDA